MLQSNQEERWLLPLHACEDAEGPGAEGIRSAQPDEHLAGRRRGRVRLGWSAGRWGARSHTQAVHGWSVHGLLHGQKRARTKKVFLWTKSLISHHYRVRDLAVFSWEMLPSYMGVFEAINILRGLLLISQDKNKKVNFVSYPFVVQPQFLPQIWWA